MQRVLITGGASGLGKALAGYYLRAGARVLITDVNADRGEQALAELQTLGDASFLVADITRDDDWDRVRDWTERCWQGLDILVNNAGVASAGRIDRTSMEDWDWIIDINLKGVVRGCRTFVPVFKRQGAGHIINIASLAAIANLPVMNSYNVTKSAVVSLSETLRFELAPWGIGVTVACPGFFQTNLADSLRTPEPGMEQTVRKLLSGGKLSADQVAARIARAAERGRFMALPQLEGKALYLIKRFAPVLYNRGMRQAGARLKKKLEQAG